MKYQTAILSKIGGRKENQDYVGIREAPPCLCTVIADGLGGHSGGKIASFLAVKKILSTFIQTPQISLQTLSEYMQIAQKAIHAYQLKTPNLSGMRTTLTILLLSPAGAIWGHIGDTRLYYFRNGRLVFQTKDHSVPQAMVNAGEITIDEIRCHPDRNLLLRCLGHDDEIRPNIEKTFHSLKKGDAFLLCTDGFWEDVTEDQMETDLNQSVTPYKWLKKMETRIGVATKKTHDNYSAATVFISEIK